MPISKVTLPDNSTQDIKDSRLPDPASSLNGRALIISSGGAWQVGFPAGFKYIDDIRIINTTSFPLYRYKICGFNRYGRLMPLTVTDQTSTTIVDKTVLTQSIDPQRGLVYYGAETNVTSTSTKIGDLYPERSMIYANYTFNSALPTYSEIFLKGTYDGHMFKLDNSTLTSWYVSAPVNSSQDNYFAVFTSGSYYMLVGNTGGTTARLNLKLNNPLFYFDGTYLFQVNLDSRIDSSPTSGSNNPVTSGGVYSALSEIATPGTLDTNNTTAQSASSSEALSGTVKLHKVAKSGTYSDLIGTPTIPSAPGTLVTNATTAQTASSGEAMSGNITLHKVSKTGTYSDLVGKPTVDTSPTNGSTNLVSSGGVYAAIPVIHSGTSDPSSSLGKNGDLYIKLSSVN